MNCKIDAERLACTRCGATVSSVYVRRNCGGGGSSQQPGFYKQVTNFAAAAAAHVAAGMPMASDDEIARRHAICLACEHMVDTACTQCGCPVRRERGYLSKLAWADQECPIGRWGKTTDLCDAAKGQ